jgi:hypothetical protein
MILAASLILNPPHNFSQIMHIQEIVQSPQQDSNTPISTITGPDYTTKKDRIAVLSTQTLENPSTLELEINNDDSDHITIHETELISDADIPPPKVRAPKQNAKSSIWNYFKTYTHQTYRHLCICLLCDAEVNYTTSMSSTMLMRHLRAKHWTVLEEMVTEEEKKRQWKEEANSVVTNQKNLTKFLKIAPCFEQA